MELGRVFRNGEPLWRQVWRADRPWTRARGLLGRPRLEEGQGMLILPCNSVHSWWMGYPLDLVYLDGGGRVVKLVEGLKPWRFSACRQARAVLELAPGAIGKHALQVGDELSWKNG
ncbi:DUF192 domain-containing protein [Gallaecimonas sp. GXIMD4217]|uniref:DUF192 domain-containing protein n=1 Tax=Gallaecimonas sp. GXIMD4217 TaxID=3131927 RepID=UPI00311AE671